MPIRKRTPEEKADWAKMFTLPGDKRPPAKMTDLADAIRNFKKDRITESDSPIQNLSDCNSEQY